MLNNYHRTWCAEGLDTNAQAEVNAGAVPTLQLGDLEDVDEACLSPDLSAIARPARSASISNPPCLRRGCTSPRSRRLCAAYGAERLRLHLPSLAPGVPDGSSKGISYRGTLVPLYDIPLAPVYFNETEGATDGSSVPDTAAVDPGHLRVATRSLYE